MKPGTGLLSLWILLLEYSMPAATDRGGGWGDGGGGCQDERGGNCRRIGQKQSLSKCYAKEGKCCETCTRLKLDIPGCPYGDRASWCDQIGNGRPISDCYSDYATCCETCRGYHSGNDECPYGDQLSWCTGIGSIYLVSSCYVKENSCCDTCGRFIQPDPNCIYGDHETWCSLIDISYCEMEPRNENCCATCAKLMATTTSSTTTTIEITTTTTRTTTTTPMRPTIPSFPNHTASGSIPISPQINPSDRHLDNYTGSPGRPTTDVSPTSTLNTSVIHSNIDINTTHPSVDDLRNVTTKPTTQLNDGILCYNNSTRHRLRHRGHGGRHRPRDQHGVDIICINTTVNSTKPTTVHYNSDKDLPSVVNTTESVTHVYSNNKPTLDNMVDHTSHVTTTKSQKGVHGEKEFQGGVSNSSAESWQTMYTRTLLISLLFLLL